MSKTFLFQAIQFSLTVLIQMIQFSISMQLVLFNPKIGPFSGATILGQSGPGSNGNEGVLRIPQSSCITLTSPSNCFVSYPGLSLWGVIPLCKDAVGVFYSPSRWDNQNLNSGLFPMMISVMLWAHLQHVTDFNG